MSVLVGIDDCEVVSLVGVDLAIVWVALGLVYVCVWGGGGGIASIGQGLSRLAAG